MTQLDLYLKALESYEGYREGEGGWTKFGQSYADRHNDQSFARADWCVMFPAEVARELGISTEIIPDTASCPTAARFYIGKDQRIDDVVAQRGDVVLYRWASSPEEDWDHFAIVTSVEGDTPDTQMLHTIEGNWGNQVARRSVRYRDHEVKAIFRPAYDLTELPDVPEPYVEAPFELSEGAEGREVEILQLGLLSHGHNVGPEGMDGKFGPATYAAVEEFQRTRGLSVDGIVGTETWNALFVG